MNTDFKVGGQELRFATSAENVKYGSGTVKDALDDIKSFDTSGMSEFGKKLYAADEKEFKRLLEISSEGIWDEGQTRWQGTAIVTDDTTAHGGKVLSLDESNLQTAAPVTFGGDPFTISLWAYINSNDSGNVFRALGTTCSFGLVCYKYTTSVVAYCVDLYGGTTSCSKIWSTGRPDNATSNKNWNHFELDYDGVGSLKYFLNGNLKRTWSKTIAREPRRLFFGAFASYVDDFELVDNGVIKSKLDFE